MQIRKSNLFLAKIPLIFKVVYGLHIFSHYKININYSQKKKVIIPKRIIYQIEKAI